MLVKCPKCNTIYRVSDEVIKGAAPAFRCSRCKHTFELKVARQEELAPEERSAQATAKTSAEDQDLRFAFTTKEELQATGKDDKHFIRPPGSDNDPQATKTEHSEPWSISPDEAGNEAPFIFADTGAGTPKIEKPVDPNPPAAHADEGDSSALRKDTGDNILPLEPYRDQQASIKVYLTLFALLVIFFSFVTVFNEAHPNATAGLVKQIPLVGPSVLKNNHLKSGVLLQSLRADYQTIQGNREVFVVSGIALNQNPVVIRDIRVAGQVYNQEGKELEQQSVWIGNAISPRIVRGMTAQDISDLQRLKPLKTFTIPPGDSVPFAIVFLKSSKAVRDFTCDVVSAEDEAA